nr:putative reverse transcriptase domain-containing protein [Tanacetum cinerariifolium]
MLRACVLDFGKGWDKHLPLVESRATPTVHSTFYVSKLKKCMADEPLAIPLDEIQVDDKLNFIEEPVKIMDREVKRLKQSRIPIVKVRWNSKRGPEFTWEREDQMQKKYPHLFPNSRIDDKLHFVEELVEIMDREIKQLKRSRIPIIKVRWNSIRGPEFTWEQEDQFKNTYPHLCTKTASSSSVAS